MDVPARIPKARSVLQLTVGSDDGSFDDDVDVVVHQPRLALPEITSAVSPRDDTVVVESETDTDDDFTANARRTRLEIENEPLFTEFDESDDLQTDSPTITSDTFQQEDIEVEETVDVTLFDFAATTPAPTPTPAPAPLPAQPPTETPPTVVNTQEAETPTTTTPPRSESLFVDSHKEKMKQYRVALQPVFYLCYIKRQRFSSCPTTLNAHWYDVSVQLSTSTDIHSLPLI